MDQEEDSGEIPAWKKEIMMKRGGAIKNWGDEREDINETEQVILILFKCGFFIFNCLILEC